MTGERGEWVREKVRNAQQEYQTERERQKNTDTDIAVAYYLRMFIYKLSRGDQDKENDLTANEGIGKKKVRWKLVTYGPISRNRRTIYVGNFIVYVCFEDYAVFTLIF